MEQKELRCVCVCVRCTDDTASHPEEHTGMTVDVTACDSGADRRAVHTAALRVASACCDCWMKLSSPPPSNVQSCIKYPKVILE